MTRHIPALLAGLALGLATAFLMPCGPTPSGAAQLQAGIVPVGVRDSGSAASPSAPSGTGAPSSPSVTARGPEMAGRPRIAASSVGTVLLGTAGYAVPSLGRYYLAIPAGPGRLVRVCSATACLTRTSTDAGPALFMQRRGRVADVSWWDFRTLCGGCDPATVGLVRVTITPASGAALPTPPSTSTLP